jgi:hypothetical protein
VHINSKKRDHMYKLPEADFSGYRRVRLDPIEVEFDKNWKPNASERSPSSRLTPSDLEKLKKTLAEEFRKVYTEELTKHHYPVVNENGDDVLRVSTAIANLHITAPERMSAGRSRTYTTTNSVTNLGAARTALSQWGRVLREGLDDATGDAN